MFWEVEFDTSEYRDCLFEMQQNDIVAVNYSHTDLTTGRNIPMEWAKIITKIDRFKYQSIRITVEVQKWLSDNNIQYPFISEEDKLLFRLTFE